MELSEKIIVERLAQALNEDPTGLTDQTPLADLERWDSLGQLGIIAYVDELLGKAVDVDSLTACRTFGDLLDLVRQIRHAS